MLRGLFIALVAAALVGVSFAADRAPSSLGLGLDGLRWGMTPPDVMALYAPMNGDGDELKMRGYLYGKCSFDLFALFTGGKLDSVIAESFDRPASCDPQIRQDFLARYGRPSETMSAPGVTRLSWRTSNTLIWYISGKGLLHVAFEQSDGSPHHQIFN
jgi:hypothetical protein